METHLQQYFYCGFKTLCTILYQKRNNIRTSQLLATEAINFPPGSKKKTAKD